MAMHALRLRPGDELMSSLKQYCSDNNLRAAYIATCVGSLKACTLRLANADRDRPNEIKTYDERFEIVSVVGTISCEGAHVHMGLADATGAGVGGHLISATVFTGSPSVRDMRVTASSMAACADASPRTEHGRR